jgi:hypothetical protein
VCRTFRNDFRSYSNEITISKVWFYLLFIVVLFDFFYQWHAEILSVNPWVAGPQQLSSKLATMSLISRQAYGKVVLLERLLLIFSIGCFVARASTLQIARLKLFVSLLVVLVVYYYLTTERGFIILIGIGAAAYADMVRWKGELINRRLVILGIVGGFGFDKISSVIESFVIYGNFGIIDRLANVDTFTMRGAVAPVWITSTIISWVENMQIPLQSGQNYLNAIGSLLPSQFYTEPYCTLSKWFIKELMPTRAEMGIGHGFSVVAEGYINAQMLGIVIHGVIVGMFSVLIRFFQMSGRFGAYGVFFYSALLSGFYTIYQRGSIAILAKFRWNILSTVLLICMASILIGAARKKNNVF